MSDVMDAAWPSILPAEPIRASMIKEMEGSTDFALLVASRMAVVVSSWVTASSVTAGEQECHGKRGGAKANTCLFHR